MNNRLFPTLPENAHPFKLFLQTLDEDPTCCPIPDIIEWATPGRIFIGYSGVNSTSRITRFRDAFNDARPDRCYMYETTFGGNRSRAVIFVPQADDPAYTGSRVVRAPTLHIVPDEEPTVAAEPKKEIPGVMQMPTYS